MGATTATIFAIDICNVMKWNGTEFTIIALYNSIIFFTGFYNE